MTDKPLITFVIPTRNRVEWIGESVLSLLGQTERNIEVIIVDDASDDGTKEFIDEWVSGDKRVKVIHNDKQMGAGASRNLGTKEAKADIVCQFDDDDVSIQERAEMTLKWFKDHPESELVNFSYVPIGYFNQILNKSEGADFNEEEFKKDGSITYFCNPSVAYRKDSFEKTKGYQSENEKETDDYGFVRNWIEAGKKIDFCPGDPVVLHRVLPDSMMAKMRGWSEAWVEK